MRGNLEYRDGAWQVTVADAMLAEPTRYLTSWRVTGAFPAPGSYGPAPQLTDGAEVTYLHNGRFQLYRDGGYTWIDTEEKGERRTESIPPPRVRAGVDVRYHDGRWQKYSKRLGWSNA